MITAAPMTDMWKACRRLNAHRWMQINTMTGLVPGSCLPLFVVLAAATQQHNTTQAAQHNQLISDTPTSEQRLITSLRYCAVIFYHKNLAARQYNQCFVTLPHKQIPLDHRTRVETFPKNWIRIRATLGYVVTEPRHAMCHLVYMGVHRGGSNTECAPPPPEIWKTWRYILFLYKYPKMFARALVLGLHIFLKLV